MAVSLVAGAHAPGVLVQVVDPPPAVEPVRVDVPAFVCVCERGPVDTPVRVGSWAQFGLVFGGFVPNGLGAYAVKAFFDQGGRVCWVTRVAAPAVLTRTLPPQPADRSVSLLESVAGFVVGAAATVRQDDLVHTYLVTAIDTSTSEVTWDRPLHPSLDVTIAMDVATGAGRATARLRGSGGVPALDVESASPGVWADEVEVVATPGRRFATSSRPEVPGSRLATPVETTAGLLVGDEVRISQDTGGPPVVVAAVVAAIDHAERVVHWEAPLPLSVSLLDRFALETSSTSILVLDRGQVVETWPDLSMRPEHERYAEAVTAASPRIRLAVTGTVPPEPARVRLRGGRDGTAGLVVADLVGDEVLDDRRGVAALVGVEEPAVLVVPDLVGTPSAPVVLAPPQPPDPCDPCAEAETVPERLDAVVVDAGARFSEEDVVRAQQALVESCERHTERVLLLDPPCAERPPTLAGLRSWASRFSSSYGVAVAPWLTVVDPRSVNRLRRVPASGHLAGMIAQTDALDGPWRSPANRSLSWAHGVDVDLTEEEHAIANEDGILVVRALPGRGLVPMGGRTLSADALWVFLPVRRTMIYLRRALRLHLAWAVFEPNGPQLARTVESAVATLMRQVWEEGGLVGPQAEDAYALQVDQSRAAAGQFLMVLGVAIARPAEFVVLRVSRTDNRLEVAEMPEVVRAGVAS